ncbi:UNVERIFIED_CONTAM: hypothetical protein FKN15_035256 [Acipenser sinensis]
MWVGSWRPHKARGPIAAFYNSPGPKYALPGATGPAAYILPSVLGPRTVNKTSAPNFILTGRSKIGSVHEDLQKTPGPGTYRVIDPCAYKYKPPHYSMTGRNSMPGDTTRKPGPGAHSPERTPGPGTYRVIDPCAYKYKPPHYSMTGRNSMPGDTTRKPGPGAHSPERVTIASGKAPVYSFGIRHSEYMAPLIVDVLD